MSDLFRSPRFHRDVDFHHHTDRSVGWLELFYDLIYVATLIQIGNFLSANLDRAGVARFTVLIFLVWWAWTGETLYQNRYVVDDITHRLLVLVQMAGVAAMGLSVAGAFSDLSGQFAISYALVRAVMMVMYVRVHRTHPESRAVSLTYILGFAIGVVLFLGSLLVAEEHRWVVWLVAISLEIVYFARPSALRAVIAWGPDDPHLVERFGIFTIIVLGEAFVKVLDDAQGAALGVDQIVVGATIVGLLFALWWLHFSDAADEVYDVSNNVSPLLWTYGHLVLAGALVMFGVASKKVFAHSIDAASSALKAETRLLLTSAVVVFYLAQALINAGLDHDTTTHLHSRRIAAYLVAAVAASLLGLTVTGLDSRLFLALLLALTLCGVGGSIAEARRAESPAHP